ncbi:MAG: GNAT family N-acetyltransferase [Desulfobacterales bacterium]|nr:GNAT family N-acetyltransferase [Desulfobacterales bacterium]
MEFTRTSSRTPSSISSKKGRSRGRPKRFTRGRWSAATAWERRDYVITEYGSAYLFGKTIRERALALIEISHPEFRPWLMEEAKRLGYVRENQCLKSRVAYPEEAETEVLLKNGVKVRLRPSRAGDVGGLKDLFYQLPPRDIYTRFFTGLTSLSVSKAEHLCRVDYENEMALMAVIGGEDKERVIGSSCYFVDPSTNLAEVAYMIMPEFQSLGLGSALQQKMAEYAKARGVRGFKAEILLENEKMLRLAQSGFETKVELKGDVYEVISYFAE